MFAAADQDGDGRLSWEEFRRLVEPEGGAGPRDCKGEEGETKLDCRGEDGETKSPLKPQRARGRGLLLKKYSLKDN